ncbi:MAG: ATP-binding cassette domain-containing protein [Planctomycetota bacterium]
MADAPVVAVRARGFTFRFPGRRDTPALDSLDFEIMAGEKVALVGSNGSGKTTLLRCLAGLQEGEGHLSVLRRRPWSLEARARTGYLPETNPLPDFLRAGEILGERCRVYGRGQADMDAVVSALDLADHLRRSVRALSLGTRRRLGLAAALLSGKDLLLLDEPTSALDPVQIRAVRTYLAGLKDRTLLLSTHLMGDAEAICSRALILGGGRILSDAPSAGLEQRFREVVG